jgi:hypothetical protein
MRKLSYAVLIASMMLETGVARAQTQQQPASQSGQAGQQSPSQTPSQTPPSQEPQNQPVQPLPASRDPILRRAVGGVAGETIDESDVTPQEMVPDNRSLVGAQVFSLGAPKLSHSYWVPFVNVTSSFDSNPVTSSANNNSSWVYWTSPSVGVDLHRISGNTNLTLNYLLIESISNARGVGHTTAQQLGLSDRFTLHRSVITVIDQFSEVPNSAFGYGGFGGGNFSTVASTGLQSGFATNQSILTGSGEQLSNTAVLQVDTYLAPRTSLTFVGSYSLLDYVNDSLLNNNQVSFQAGYNHIINRKDSIGVFYRFDGFRYSHITQSIDNHSAQFSYGRRVTGKLAFQISGGPAVAYSKLPITTSSLVSTTTTATSTRQIYWDLGTTLTYGLRRTALSGSYNHFVTGGSGVLSGALTDNFTGTASRQIRRNVSGSLTFGYSRNQGSAASTTNGVKGVSQTYNYWFADASINRTFGRAINASVGYHLQSQSTGVVACSTGTCPASVTENVIYLELGWRPRPFTF